MVAIVGRPNVGKSTLFNRLLRRRDAIVEDRPGVTRDRRYGIATILERQVTLVDTGGFDPEAEAGLDADILQQTRYAVEEADLVLVLMDAKEGLTEGDRLVVETLRRTGRPVLHAANKVDGPTQAAEAAELHALGVPELLHISAAHGSGMEELQQALVDTLPVSAPVAEAEADEEAPIRIALVGRPNVGKSSLLNYLAGAERSIVSDRPGTTRDPVDIEITTRSGTVFTVIDTAGVRRKRSVEPGMERYAVLRALRRITEADVTCLMLDPAEGVVEQDAKLAALAHDTGKGLVLIFSKSDTLPSPVGPEKRRLTQDVQDQLRFVPYAPLHFISSRTGQGVARLLPTVARIHRESGRRISTADLNRFLEDTTAAHTPPNVRGRPIRLFYMTQPETRPPTFILSVSSKKGFAESYQNYILNSLRKTFGFDGVPLRLWLRRRKNRKKIKSKKRRPKR